MQKTTDSPRNGPTRIGDILLGQFVRSQEDGVSIGGLTGDADIVTIFREFLQADGRNFVERFDLKFAWIVVIDITVRLPFAAAVFDLNVSRRC